MNVIYKYPLKLEDKQAIRMAEGAEILSVQLQGVSIVIWATCQVGKAEAKLHTERKFRIIGTGHEYNPAGLRYIDTVQQQHPVSGTRFAWHVFEEIM